MSYRVKCKDKGGPGLRAQYNANDYAACVIGPDGNSIAVMCREAEAWQLRESAFGRSS